MQSGMWLFSEPETSSDMFSQGGFIQLWHQMQQFCVPGRGKTRQSYRQMVTVWVQTFSHLRIERIPPLLTFIPHPNTWHSGTTIQDKVHQEFLFCSICLAWLIFEIRDDSVLQWTGGKTQIAPRKAIVKKKKTSSSFSILFLKWMCTFAHVGHFSVAFSPHSKLMEVYERAHLTEFSDFFFLNLSCKCRHAV